MSKRRPIIALFSNGLYMGGTEKMLAIMLKTMVKEGTFNFALFYKAELDRTREPQFRAILGDNKLVPWASIPECIEILRLLQPDIVHFFNSGIAEFPMVKGIRELLPNTKLVQTAVFGNINDQIELDKVIFVSKHIQHLVNRFGTKYAVVRNAIEGPYTDQNLRAQLDISPDVFVFGHIGRPDRNTYSDLNLRAYKEIENDKTMFLWLPENEFVVESVAKLGIKRIKLLPRTTDDFELSRFYNTIDVLAHSRRDGEVNSDAIWTAQSHGKPIISHYATPFNGHIETISNCGFVCAPGDIQEYIKIIKSFLDKEIDYNRLSENCIKMWKETCYAEDIANQQLTIYKDLLK